MKKLRRSRRYQGGFSLLEALTASVCMLAGMVGVIILIQQSARVTTSADFNVQASKLSQELLSQWTAIGYQATFAKVPATDVCDGVFSNGTRYWCRLEFIDTSPVGNLPNLGQPSVLVRVRMRRMSRSAGDQTMHEEGILGMTPSEYVVEAYVIQG